MNRWRYPSLSLHGIEGAFFEAGAKTVIPRKVIGKFSIRIVPDMDPDVVEKQVDNEICVFIPIASHATILYCIHGCNTVNIIICF